MYIARQAPDENQARSVKTTTPSMHRRKGCANSARSILENVVLRLRGLRKGRE